MKTVTKRRWLTSDAYVEVAYRPHTKEVDVKLMVLDPRKAQQKRRKFWNRGLWMPFRPIDHALYSLAPERLGSCSATNAARSIVKEISNPSPNC